MLDKTSPSSLKYLYARTKTENVAKKSLGSGKETMTLHFQRVTCLIYPARVCIYEPSYPVHVFYYAVILCPAKENLDI